MKSSVVVAPWPNFPPGVPPFISFFLGMESIPAKAIKLRNKRSSALAELADHIQRAGGRVTAVVTLVSAGRIKTLRGEPRVIKKLQKRKTNEILNIFGIQPVALTANEAQYLVSFRTPDEIRNRLAKARKEIYRRLHSKGIRWTNECKDTGSAC